MDDDDESSGRAPTSFATPTTMPPTLAGADLQQYCHSGFPLDGVYSPGRLEILSPCVAVTGTVSATNVEHDGDVHISLNGVDPKWVNDVNRIRADGSLVAEVVPDIPQPTPAEGSQVTLIGPWVLDTNTGWLEIHPVWAILPA